MRLIFMGTPDFAVGTLEALIEAGHEVALVVTQPDKPRGRSKKLQYPPVKEAALSHNIEVFQPKRLREAESIEYLKKYQPDCIVVVAFGQILPKEILEMPKYCCVNVHASLLPKYRGAAPIQWAVINGEKVSGVTTMRMDEGLDTGDMILKEEVTLAPDETGGSLFDRLAEVGAKLAVQTLQALEDGTAEFTPQDHEKATQVGMIKKSFGEMDFTKSAVELERLIRGLNPWPGTYTEYQGKTLKIWDATVKEGGDPSKAGTIVNVTKHSFGIQTKDGILVPTEIQLEGKKRMTAEAFLCGVSLRRRNCAWHKCLENIKNRRNSYVLLVGPNLHSCSDRSDHLSDRICKSQNHLCKIFKIPQYVRTDRSTGGGADLTRCRHL